MMSFVTTDLRRKRLEMKRDMLKNKKKNSLIKIFHHNAIYISKNVIITKKSNR